MTVPANTVELPDGSPRAMPFYIVDNTGKPIGSANALNVNASFSASSVAINDPNTPSQKLAIDSSGKIGINSLPAITATNPSVGTDGSAIPSSSTLIGASDGTNLQQLLVESSSNKNLRISVYNGTNELAVDASGRISILGITNALPAGSALLGGVNLVDSGGTNKLAVDSSGRLTLVPNQTVEIVDSGGTNKLAVDASGRLTLVPNQVIEIGDGTTPTQKLAIDSSGRLTLIPNSSVNTAQIGGQVPTLDNTTIQAVSVRGKGAGTAGDTALLLNSDGSAQFDLRKVLGAVLSASNPNINEPNVQNWIRSGQQGYFASTDIYTPANINNAFSIFNPNASGKTLIILSMTVTYGASAQIARMRITTSNPSYANTLSAANFDLGNMNTGGGTSPVASVTYATASTSAPSLSAASIVYTGTQTNTTSANELIPTGVPLVLVANTGLAVYFSNTATGNLCFNVKWIEF